MAFYDEMAEMARDLLAPDAEGGLGQGAIQIVRSTPGTPDPAQPWVPVQPVEAIETVDQIGTIKAEYRQGEAVIGVDKAFMVTPTQAFVVAPGDLVRIGGVNFGHVVRAERFGSNDVPIYDQIWVKR